MPEPAPLGPPLIHLAVVDDNTFYREWLGTAGTLPAHQHVAARAATAGDLARMLPRLPDRRCDVVLLDLRVVPGLAADPLHGEPPVAPGDVQGKDAVTLVAVAAAEAVASGSLTREPAILVYTQEPAPRVHVACLLAGAVGVVHKSESLERLAEAIDIVAAGGVVIDERTAHLIETLAQQHRLDLTPSAETVLALTAHGWSRRRIAREIKAGESTVDKHLRAIRDKFGDDVHLVDLADSFGLRDMAPPDGLAGPRPAADATGTPSAAKSLARLRRLARRLR